MKKLFLTAILFGTLALTGSGYLIPAGDYRFNSLYIPKQVAGRYGWLNGLEYNNSLTVMEMFDEIEELAIFGVDPDPVKSRRGVLKDEEIPLLQKRMALFRQHKLPMVGALYDRGFNNRPLPTEKELDEFAKNPAFLGVRAFNEWGTNLDRFLMIKFHRDKIKEAATKRRIPLFKDFFPANMKEPLTREAYTEAARFAWLKMNKPFKGQVYALSGSQSWAISWAGGWEPIRAVITENRTPYRNNMVFNSLTRSAARMWQIPYGFLQAYDWNCRIGHPFASHMQNPSNSYRKQQGVIRITPSLYRRLWYYMALSNAAVLLDESDHMRYADWGGKGNYRLSWYGEICAEIQDFQRLNPDTGINYNPVGLLLSWHNGWAYKGSNAFNRFPYNDGEHMTREVINSMLFNYFEKKELSSFFAATPFGDLYDILRLDTPSGILPLELLKNYKVLFLLGEHQLDNAAVTRLQEYVRNGGTLIINAAQLKNVPSQFTGVLPGKTAVFTEMSDLNGKKLPSGAFTATVLEPQSAKPLYMADAQCLGAINRFGDGQVITLGAHWLLENERRVEGSIVHKKLLPVAPDLMAKLLPSLTPFTLEGDRVKEQLAWQVNRKGDNWILAAYNNAGVTPACTTGAHYSGPEEFDRSKKVTCRIRVPQDIKFAVNLISGEKCYFAGDSKGAFLEYEIEPGDLLILEFSGQEIPARRLVRKVNLAAGKKADASSFIAPFSPDKAVDGDTNFTSAWYSQAAPPQHLTIDLGETKMISALRIFPAWSFDSRVFPRITQFVVKASTDGRNYRTVMDESGNIMPDTPRGVFRKFAPVNARYLRLEVLFNSSRQGGQIVEVQAFGSETETVTIPWRSNAAKETFPPEILAMTQIKSLTDFKPVSVKQDEKPLAVNKECFSGQPLKIRKQKFSRGFGCHAKSEIIFHLPAGENWKMFTTRCGIDNQGNRLGTVRFMVYTDGKLAADSGKITYKDASMPLWADLTGVKELKLVVDDCGDGIYGDIADWAEPVLRK